MKLYELTLWKDHVQCEQVIFYVAAKNIHSALAIAKEKSKYEVINVKLHSENFFTS